MTKINNAGDNIRYDSQQVKVVVLKSRHVLCQSPVTLYEQGSDTDGWKDFGDNIQAIQ